jgi:hypothetical protein
VLSALPCTTQVAETLSDDILAKMHAPPKAADVPVINPQTIDQVSGCVIHLEWHPERAAVMHSVVQAAYVTLHAKALSAQTALAAEPSLGFMPSLQLHRAATPLLSRPPLLCCPLRAG